MAAELLEPEQAFRFSARVADAGHVEVRFAIADGYYLYRDRLRFSAEGARLFFPESLPVKEVDARKSPSRGCVLRTAFCPKSAYVGY